MVDPIIPWYWHSLLESLWTQQQVQHSQLPTDNLHAIYTYLFQWRLFDGFGFQQKSGRQQEKPTRQYIPGIQVNISSRVGGDLSPYPNLNCSPGNIVQFRWRSSTRTATAPPRHRLPASTSPKQCWLNLSFDTTPGKKGGPELAVVSGHLFLKNNCRVNTAFWSAMGKNVDNEK